MADRVGNQSCAAVGSRSPLITTTCPALPTRVVAAFQRRYVAAMLRETVEFVGQGVAGDPTLGVAAEAFASLFVDVPGVCGGGVCCVVAREGAALRQRTLDLLWVQVPAPSPRPRGYARRNPTSGWVRR